MPRIVVLSVEAVGPGNPLQECLMVQVASNSRAMAGGLPESQASPSTTLTWLRFVLYLRFVLLQLVEG